MLTITLTNARLLGASAWLAALLAAAPPAAAQSLDEILAGIEEAMGEWAEHRAQTIDVKSISGLEVAAASGTIEQLQARLKSLLTKKRSNREWKGYWSGEAELAERLLQAYERVAPVGAEGPMDAQVATLKAAYAEAAKAARRAVSKVQTIADSADAARSSLSKALAETRDAVPELEQAIGARKVELVAASEPVARLEAAAAKADGEAAEAAGEAVAAAVAKRDAAAEALQAARDARSQAEALIAYLEPLLGGGKVPPTAPPADAVIAQRIETLIAADKALTEAQQAREAAVVSEAAARAAAERAAVLRDAFRARRPTLEAWAALARDKMTNQDAYLEAINADIAAVEERLRGMADKPEANSVGKSLKVCEAERRAGQSPLERYRECEQATRDEVADLEALLVDAQAADVLNERQASSVQTLLQAQDKDLALAIREVAISGGEARRATKERESERWRELWQGCAERAKEKKHELAAALQSTKDTARTITVNRSFFASERQALSQRGAGLKAKLAERSGAARYVGALLETAWSFIKNAYMVPVYLVLAWLLLKLIARVERRVVESAKRNVEGRDEEQRVDTLASVVRAALKLVVFVATGLLCLEGMGVDTGPILGGAAIFGLAISFGSQSLVKGRSPCGGRCCGTSRARSTTSPMAPSPASSTRPRAGRGWCCTSASPTAPTSARSSRSSTASATPSTPRPSGRTSSRSRRATSA